MCGIAGYIGSNFDPVLFKQLLWYQDKRGGHGCGFVWMNTEDSVEQVISVGPSYVKGSKFKDVIIIEPTETQYAYNRFSELLSQGVELPANPKIIIAHARAATVGGLSKEFTQPFIVQTPDDIYVVAHNGTVKNWQELRDDLFDDMDIRSQINNDSQLLAHCVAYEKMEVLSKYDGAATLLWYKVSDLTTMYFWLGTELHYRNGVEPKTPARPLHMWECPDGGIYFSSESEPLFNVRYLFTKPDIKIDHVWELAVNKVQKIKDTRDSLAVIQKVERIRSIVTTSSHSYSNYAGVSGSSLSFTRFIDKFDVFPKAKEIYAHARCYYGLMYQGMELLNSKIIRKDGHVVGAEPIYLTADGTVLYRSGNSKDLVDIFGAPFHGGIYKLYIFKGVIMKDEESYVNVYRRYGTIQHTPPHEIAKYSLFAVYSSINNLVNAQSGYFYFPNNERYTGEVTYPFSTFRLTFKDCIAMEATELSMIKIKTLKKLWMKTLSDVGIEIQIATHVSV